MQAFINISLEMTNAVATLTLNRPQKLNSLTRPMHTELRRAFEVIESGVANNSIRVLLITGAGR